MNKSEFLALLRVHLSPLPPEELGELLEDYESHFAFGLQSGKTEEEIVHELGNPEELAREALEGRYIPKDHVYWSDPHPPAANTPVFRSSLSKRRTAFSGTIIYIGLFFLNIIVIPLLISFWGVGVSLAASALAAFLSPVTLLLEYWINGNFYPAKAYAVVAILGAGILIMLGSRYVFKGLTIATKTYWAWTARFARGGQ